MLMKRLHYLMWLPLLTLSGCHAIILNPPGDVARQQSHTMVVSTLIIALIIVPVLVAVAVIAWRYRASNKKARYDPEWEHSTQLELVVWSVPLVIVIAIGAISWIGTHRLDPYRSLDRIAPGQPVTASTPTLEVEAVSLRWKWLFFYPQYGIATVNELAAPINVPIHFKLTSDPMMDSFFIPALAGQVYTMAGMQTILNGVMSTPGRYKGFSSNFSGMGFTDMRFSFYAMQPTKFKLWVKKVRTQGSRLDRQEYNKLYQPERHSPIRYYAAFQPDLYDRILNMCVNPGQMCMSDMMAADMGMHMKGMHGMPMKGMHGMPMKGMHGMPMKGMHGMHMKGMHGMHMKGMHGMPMKGMHGMPMKGMHGMHMKGMHGMHMKGMHGMHMKGMHGMPMKGMHGMHMRGMPHSSRAQSTPGAK